MKTVWRLVAKEYRLFWGDRLAMSLTFLIPIGLIAIWGSIFGRADSGPRNLHLAFLNESSSAIGRKLERVLDTSSTFRLVRTYADDNGRQVPFDTGSIKDYIRRGDASAALVIPADAYSDTSIGLKLHFYYDPRNEMEMQIIKGVLTQTIMSQIPSVFMSGIRERAVKVLGSASGNAFNRGIAGLVSKYFRVDTSKVFASLNDTGDFYSRAADNGSNFFKGILSLDSEQLVGKTIANPWATRSVGGWAMMFLLFTVTASSASLFEEKQNGVALRILAAPISRVHILWSKYLYNMSLGILQLFVLFTFGSVMFHVDVLSNLPGLVAVILAASAACTAFGMFLSSISATQAQARGLGTFLILAMSSIGGAWFPVSLMPDFIQSVSKVTIVYWAMDGFLEVLWRQSPLVAALPDIAMLLLIGGIITSASIWRFKRGDIF